MCDQGRERDDARALSPAHLIESRGARGAYAHARWNACARRPGTPPFQSAPRMPLHALRLANRAPRDSIKCAGLRNDAFNLPYRGAQRPSRLPARGRQRGRLRYPAAADTRRSAHACVAATPAARSGASRRPCGSATHAARRLMQADQHERLVGTSQ
ncbi:hypothetical protein FFI87_001390 [Burkholderia sp. KBS0801]|nr:hypothetical protein FFI87_001390 [Burkholderia sp. KBS0801]